MVTRSQCAAALVVLVGAMSSAACGGTSANPGVANIGTGTESTATTAATGQPIGTGKRDGYSEMLNFSRCMRAHGVPNFPDPQFSGGGIRIQGGPGLDKNSPNMQAAFRACHSILPGIGG